MNYILYVAYITTTIGAAPAQQIGPFHGLPACEVAAAQIETVDKRVRSTVCLNLNRKNLHWNGKEFK